MKLSLQSLLRSRSLTRVDVLNTVALVAEAARMSKVNPSALAFADTPWRTASTLITRDIHCRGLSLRDNEHLVRESCLGTEVLASMDTATFFESLTSGGHFLLPTSILHGHRAAC